MSDIPLSYDEYFSVIRPFDQPELVHYTIAYFSRDSGELRIFGRQTVESVTDFVYLRDNEVAYCVNKKLFTEQLFFLNGSAVYRIYLPGGTVDEICDIATKYNMDRDYYYPVSNPEIWWTEINSEWYRKAAEEAGMPFRPVPG